MVPFSSLMPSSPPVTSEPVVLDVEMRKILSRKQHDCKFYHYAKCSRGENCGFRHEPASLGSKTMCRLWLRGKCQEEHCKQRHMKLENNNSPCFSKQQNGSCQIKDCPFDHSDLSENAEDNEGTNKVSMKKGRKPRNLKQNGYPKQRQEGLPKTQQFVRTSDLSVSGDEETESPSPVQISEKHPVSLQSVLLQKLEDAERKHQRDVQTSVMNAKPYETVFVNRDNININDCIYFYYDSCHKGVKCPFRHSPAAIGCKVVCRYWVNGRCGRYHCRFRHMILENNPKPCLWEKKDGNCQIENCPFQHQKSKSDDDKVEEQIEKKVEQKQQKNEDPIILSGQIEAESATGRQTRNPNIKRKKKRDGVNSQNEGSKPDAANSVAGMNLPAVVIEQIEQIIRKVKEAEKEETKEELKKQLEEEMARKQEEMLSALKLEEKKKMEDRIIETFTCHLF